MTPLFSPPGMALGCVAFPLVAQGSGVLSLMVFSQHCPLPLESRVHFPESFPGVLALSLSHPARHAVGAAVSLLQWGCQSSNYMCHNPLLCSFFYSISSLANMKAGKKHKGWLCWQAPLTSTALHAKRRGSGRRNEEPAAAVASLGLLSPGEVKHGE